MATANERLTVVGWMTEPNQRAPIVGTEVACPSFAATGAGDAGGTTVVATPLTGTADIYVGQVLRCIGGTSANVNVDVWITAYDGTDTLTTTGFPAQTQSADQFSVVTPPDPVFVERAGGSPTNVDGRNAGTSDTNRTEADDYYNGDYMVAVAADNITAGTIRQITDFTQATGVAICASFGANTAIGDLFVARDFPKWWGPPSFTPKFEDLPQEAQTGNWDAQQTVKGAKSWAGTGVLPLKGSGTAAGSGTAGVAPPELKRPIGNIMTGTPSTGAAAVAQAGTSPANSTTVFNLATGTMAVFPVGTPCVSPHGELSWVTAQAANGGDPDSITHSPAFAAASAATEVIRGGYAWAPMQSGHLTMTWDVWKGAMVRYLAYGGMPTSVKLSFKRGQVPLITMEYAGNFYLKFQLDKPTGYTPTHDTVRPAAAVSDILTLGSGTKIIADEVEVDFGLETVQEDAFTLPNGSYGPRIVGMFPTFSVAGKLDKASPNNTWAELQRYMGSQTFSLGLQHGRTFGQIVGCYANVCEWVAPEHSVADNLNRVAFTARVLGSGVSGLGNFLFGAA